MTTPLSLGQIVIFVGLWSVFGISLFRAIIRKRLNTPSSRAIWLLFFLWTVPFSLWGEETEHLINGYFGGLPVALYLKGACMMLTFHGYALVLRPMRPATPFQRALDWLTPMALVLMFSSFVWYAQNPDALSYEALRFRLIGVRDAVMGLLVVFVFVPYTLRMYRNEINPPLRLKQLAAAVCFICFGMNTLGGMLAAMMNLLDRPDAEAIYAIFFPCIYLGFVAFIITLAPYRWLAVLIQPDRWWIYYRLRRLEYQIAMGMHGKTTDRLTLRRLLRIDEMELAIYRSIISILDQYQRLPDAPNTIRQLRTLVREEYAYAEFMNRLTKVRLT